MAKKKKEKRLQELEERKKKQQEEKARKEKLKVSITQVRGQLIDFLSILHPFGVCELLCCIIDFMYFFKCDHCDLIP